MFRKIASSSLTASAVAFGYLFYPKRQVDPVEDQASYQVRSKIEDITNHPNSHLITRTPKKICIIGAGISGCCLLKELSLQGYDVEVLERRESVGGVWANGYDNLGLQFPRMHYNYPDFDFADDVPALPNKKQVIEYIESYLQHFKIQDKVQLNKNVSGLIQNPDDSWTVSINDEAPRTYDFIIAANGLFSDGHAPQFKGQENFQGQIIHSAEYQNMQEQVKGQKVVIVGSGRSATDLAVITTQHGASTTLVAPQTQAHVTTDISVLGIPLPFLLFSRAGQNFCLANYEGKKSQYFQTYFRGIRESYWRRFLQSANEKAPHKYVRMQNEPETRIIQDPTSINPEFFPMLAHEKFNIVQGKILHMKERSVMLKTGEEIEADLIILATGFRPSKIVEDIVGPNEDHYNYRNTIKPGVKNAMIMGYYITIFLPLVVNMNAIWISEVLSGNVKLPPNEQMQEDIDSRKQFMEKWLAHRYSNAYVNPSIYMCDQFLTDMGLSPYRKKNWFQEFFTPLTSADYSTVLKYFF